MSRILLATAKGRWRRLHRVVCLLLGSDFACRDFGSDLYLPHPYGLVVHGNARIGDRCRIFQHVTIGEHNRVRGVARIGDDVFIGAGAVLIGPVTIGDGAQIGANAVVMSDVPPRGVAVGAPARIVPGGGSVPQVDDRS